MIRRKFLMLVVLLSVTVVFFLGVQHGLAAQSSNVSEISPRSHDTDSVIQRKINRITPERRAQAAARLRAEREAKDPSAKARRQAAREAAAQAASARIAALNNTTSINTAAGIKSVQDASAREASARRLATRDAKIQGGI